MTAYNVLTKVVDVIEAETPEAAYAELTTRLTRAGFDVHDHDVPPPFESDVPA